MSADNRAFQAFGEAFEDYANRILRAMYPESGELCNRLVCNPRGTLKKDGSSPEIADACLNDLTEVVLFESKGVFVPEGSTRDTEMYLETLREKYGESRGRKKGAAQLGRWIGDIARGAVTPIEQDWRSVERVYPVLVAYDERMDRPGHAEFFVKEFAKALDPERMLPDGFMKKGPFTVAPLTVMTIDDLEVLESSVRHFRLTDLLRDYAHATEGGVRVSLHDYMAFTEGKKYRLSGSALAERALTLLEEAHRKMFPHLPFPKEPQQSGGTARSEGEAASEDVRRARTERQSGAKVPSGQR